MNKPPPMTTSRLYERFSKATLVVALTDQKSQIMGFHPEEVQSPDNSFIKETTGELLLLGTANEGQT
jgi:hypothetical protein